MDWNRKSIVYLFVCLFGCFNALNAQNLVLNASFEQQQQGKPAHWNAVAGTPDWHQNRNKAIFGNPSSTLHGDHYLGLAINAKSTEAVQGFLTKALQKDSLYRVSLYMTSNKSCLNGLQEVSLGLFPHPLAISREMRDLSGYHLQLIPDETSTIKEANCTHVYCEAYYLARGSEQHIVLGNFIGSNQELLNKADSSMHLILEAGGDIANHPASKDLCHYIFMDSVAVRPASSPGNAIIMDDVLFESNKAVLLTSSHKALQKLVNLLQDASTVNMEIIGHTDNHGKAADNLTLSTKRAQAVVDFLIKQGITSERLFAIGLGEEFPIADNQTTEGRAKNRRVTFCIKR